MFSPIAAVVCEKGKAPQTLLQRRRVPMGGWNSDAGMGGKFKSALDPRFRNRLHSGYRSGKETPIAHTITQIVRFYAMRGDFCKVLAH